MMLKMTQLSHYFISQYLKRENLIGADFTCGNGEDTTYLASFSQIKQVFSFDIQEEALAIAKLHCNHPKVQYICDGHENMDHYLQCFDIGIFNFGYFPAGDHQITTMLDTSIKAVQKALKLLNKKGLLLLVLYPGHSEGSKEAKYLEEYCQSLNPAHFVIMKLQMIHKVNSPYIIAIEKSKKYNDT